ncbi:MAG: uracil-DNA glycosylase [Flavobacteriales bacterium]|nr:uracil-DNA glycosylase [Flavobacteriales bacterium]MCB9204117.1 uracil-DNA glycosylase [Flavobacteriales bacterium]
MKPKIESSWLELLNEEFEAEYFSQLREFLVQEKETQQIFPPGSLIFNAFDKTPVDHVKAVIIGQDPYHGPGQAHGLCFSVNDGVKFPPSLQNIFKELKEDIGMEIPFSGNLTKWAEQGVLLLNATLTVRARNAGSHQGKGWEQFTDATIRKLANKKKNLVFLLWGRFAQNKEELINKENGHLILKAAHPSPFSAHSGFFGCKHFSRCNTFLSSHGIEPIDWNLNTQ